MANVTMSIDGHLLAKARRAAMGKNTSVNAMVREYLEKVTTEESRSVEEKIKRFRATVKKYGVTLGPITWKREDLYER